MGHRGVVRRAPPGAASPATVSTWSQEVLDRLRAHCTPSSMGRIYTPGRYYMVESTLRHVRCHSTFVVSPLESTRRSMAIESHCLRRNSNRHANRTTHRTESQTGTTRYSRTSGSSYSCSLPATHRGVGLHTHIRRSPRTRGDSRDGTEWAGGLSLHDGVAECTITGTHSGTGGTTVISWTHTHSISCGPMMTGWLTLHLSKSPSPNRRLLRLNPPSPTTSTGCGWNSGGGCEQQVFRTEN